ncbi:MAG: acyltransferase family protein [Porphyromonadaceae bacterium]|nr:acyltransferase family protein [Porphyromonadaceae bacterium]
MHQQTFSRGVSDSLRGVMQVGIMFSHLSYTSAEPALLFDLANKFGTSIIALYFFISGYGLMQSVRSVRGVGHLGKRLWGIFKPMLFITLMFGLYQVFYGSGYNDQWLSQLIWQGRTPLPNSWFVFVLMWLYISFWLAFRYLQKRRGLALLTLLLLSIVGMVWCQVQGYERAWWVTTLAFFSGSVYAEYEAKIYGYANRWWAIGLSSLFVGLLVLADVAYFLPLAFVVIPIVAIVLMNRLGYTAWVDRAKSREDAPKHPIGAKIDKGIRQLLAYLARISYELYLVHGVLIIVFRGELIYICSDYGYALAVIVGSILAADLLHSLFHLKLHHPKA